MTIEEAKKVIEEKGLNYEIAGEGDTIYGQMPLTGSAIAQGGTVVIYTEKNYNPEFVKVPDVRGYSLADANYLLTNAGLNFIANGVAANDSGSVVQMQSEPDGAMVAKGTIIELSFGVNDQSG